MALQWYKLPIKKVVRETEDAISIVLEVPESLRETFQYLPGQYLTLQLYIRGERHRRAYSLSSSPHADAHLQITSKKVPDGMVSQFLDEFARSGQELEVLPPLGNFVPDLDPATGGTSVLIAGGSGITPIFSILKSMLLVQPGMRVHLLFGNRDMDSIIFRTALAEWVVRYHDRFTVTHVLESPPEGWDGPTGLMNRIRMNQLLREVVGPAATNAHYYLCGPNAMIHEASLALADRLVAPERIHREHFTASLDIKEESAKASPVKATQVQDDGELRFPVRARIVLDGRESDIDIDERSTVLEAAIDAGLDPPFACQIGACTTCRAKLREGRVSMDEREALTDSEIEEGYILTCQSRPLTNRLVVDYDG